MELEKKFFNELDSVVQIKWKDDIFPQVKLLNVISIAILIKDEKISQIFKKYIGDNYNKIDVVLSVDTTCYLKESKILYVYNNMEVKPEGYYILPDNAKYASMIDILKECIKQDTYKPDIKHLQKPDIKLLQKPL